MNEEKNKIPKKTVKTGRCFVESGPEKEKRPAKTINLGLFKQTYEKEWKNYRIRPDKRKCCEDNTLAYDLTNLKPKIQRPQRRKIESPKMKTQKKGKKILVEKLKEHPRNTLAYH